MGVAIVVVVVGVVVVAVVVVVFVVGVVVVVIDAVVVVVVVVKCRPKLKRFVHFYFQICFPPQRCALFRHLNFQKCSETAVFCHVLLPNGLRASQLPKMVRAWCIL